MIDATVWHDVVVVLSAIGARLRPTAGPQDSMYGPSTATAPRAARRITLHVMREEEQRLLR
jgi:hypothetical protein